MRIRGVDLGKVEETRAALREIRARGLRTCILLRLPVKDWKVKYLPEDLREAHERGRQLGAAFGDVVDAWEVDNEPDLGFVPELPERYTAFLKATYLGLRAGAAAGRARPPSSVVSPPSSAVGLPPSALRPPPSNEPLILMGSLGLPPGPWLERFAANDGFAYTDAYNWHYYGYADDFSSVYRQHQRAALELGVRGYELGVGEAPRAQDRTPLNSERLTPSLREKALPLFLTEIGYGMLGPKTRDTESGRLRQFCWFESVGHQVDSLRIEGPMGFYLPPFLENGVIEYGLTAPTTGGAVGRLSTPDEGLPASHLPSPISARLGAPWPQHIGTRIAGNSLTPAGAFWLGAARRSAHRTRKHSPLYTPSPGLDFALRESWTGTGLRAGNNGVAPSPLPTFRAPGLENVGQTPDRQQPATVPNNQSPLTDNHDPSGTWTVATPPPTPIVLDFLPGEGLQPIKRYHAYFVSGREPVGQRKPEIQAPLKPQPSPPRSEELMIHIRTANGNLYEVYPTRQATPAWSHFLEPAENFTMSFYGRANPPWRFVDNRPAAISLVLYPRQLPAVFEFRHPQILRLGAEAPVKVYESRARVSERDSNNQEPITDNRGVAHRYAAGRITLYNFSESPVVGRLLVPANVISYQIEVTGPGSATNNPQPITDSSTRSLALTLAAGERREIPVVITVPHGSYQRSPAEIVFIAEPGKKSAQEMSPLSLSASRLALSFIADVAGLPATVLSQPTRLPADRYTVNLATLLARPLATEEVPLAPLAPVTSEKLGVKSPDSTPPGLDFAPRESWTGTGLRARNNGAPSAFRLPPLALAQPGATIEPTPTGFTVTVTSIPPGKERRIEVDLPWPDDLPFPPDAFLSLEYRLRE